MNGDPGAAARCAPGLRQRVVRGAKGRQKFQLMWLTPTFRGQGSVRLPHPWQSRFHAQLEESVLGWHPLTHLLAVFTGRVHGRLGQHRKPLRHRRTIGYLALLLDGRGNHAQAQRACDPAP